MLPPVISHSPDLQRLIQAGYHLEICGGHLIVHHIPYVNLKKEIKYGSFVCALNLASTTRTARPNDHTIYFSGEKPCDRDGLPLNAIINNSQTIHLSNDLIVNHFFSSKPSSGIYENYFDKIRTYAEIVSSQAKAIDNTVTDKPNKDLNGR